MLNPNASVKNKLEQLDSIFEETAKKCLYMIFNKQCTTAERWHIVDRLNGDFPHNVCLGCGNSVYQAIAVIGTSDSEIMELIGSTKCEDVLDAFGEMLNTYLGMLMDNPLFVKNFGILTQALAHYSADINFYSEAWGYNGVLQTPAKGLIYLGFAIKSNELTLE